MNGRNVLELPVSDNAEVVEVVQPSTAAPAATGMGAHGPVVLDGHYRGADVPDGALVLGPPDGPYAVTTGARLKALAREPGGAVEVDKLDGVEVYDDVTDANDAARSRKTTG